ncbi:MAG: tyrosine-specific transport protein [Chlamydiales bacterium]|jgi:tyrosine-specific transport protein
MAETNNTGSTTSGVLLIAGTSIGAGMLGIPLLSGLAGFVPCMLANFLCWLFMLSTGLLILEATLWMEDGANIISMTERFLGPWGKKIGGCLYLFLYYCLLTAYFAGGAPIFVQVLNHSFKLSLGVHEGYCLFAVSFGVILFMGARLVDRMNFILIIGMVISFFSLLSLGSAEVKYDLLARADWPLTLLSFPILFSAYGYHNVIPSLCTYLKRNTENLRKAIIIGSSIPFLVYSIWQWLIIGSVPKEILTQMMSQGVPATEALKVVGNSEWLVSFAEAFSFFALVTSLLGVSLAMLDFLSDGFKARKTDSTRAVLCILVFLPPLFFAWHNPNLFIFALEIAGGFGEAILNGLLPVMMVWVGRYHMNLDSEVRLPGGRYSLVLITVLTLFIIALETTLIIMGKPH